MKVRRDLLILFLSFLFLITSYYSRAQHDTTWCRKAYKLVKTVEKHHYNPRAVDEEFSAIVGTSLVKMIDPQGFIFSREDVKEIAIWQSRIHNDIFNMECSFIEKIVSLYQKKLVITDSLLYRFQHHRFDFNANDRWVFNKADVYSGNDQSSRKWENFLKFQILSSALFDKDSTNDLREFSAEKMLLIQEKVIQREICKIKSILNYSGGLKHYIYSRFLKAISSAFDPHTLYLSPAQKQEFEEMLSIEAASYGFQLSRNELGEIEISGIVPGSPAWNCNAINEGDVILYVKTPEGNVKDFNCLAMEDARQFIASPDINEASFHVQKRNGKELDVTLFKEQLTIEENVIQSFILKGEQKIGYIYLPSFYSQMDDQLVNFTNGCANDLAKELIKLKREGIEGLIIDLRNNGGGSMLEAILMAGIFIDYGAVGIIDSRHDPAVTLTDPNRGTIFNAPLLILQNTYSASASELFAAAMQDHNRAVIAGSNSYGKSTAQQILPLDAYKDEQVEDMEGAADGYVKLTLSKFYRATGESHQREGVKPDIILPTIYDKMEVGEISHQTALNASVINKKTYYSPFDPLPVKELQDRSKQRIITDSAFVHIRKKSLSNSGKHKQFSVPLEYTQFRMYSDSIANSFKESIFNRKSIYLVKNPDYIENINNLAHSKKEINKNVLNDIENDHYIREAYFIINDLIELTTN